MAAVEAEVMVAMAVMAAIYIQVMALAAAAVVTAAKAVMAVLAAVEVEASAVMAALAVMLLIGSQMVAAEVVEHMAMVVKVVLRWTRIRMSIVLLLEMVSWVAAEVVPGTATQRRVLAVPASASSNTSSTKHNKEITP